MFQRFFPHEIQGLIRRGFYYAMYGNEWTSWYPDNKPWVNYKTFWGQPGGTKKASKRKFGAMMHNGDIEDPQVLGFEGNLVRILNLTQNINSILELIFILMAILMNRFTISRQMTRN